MPLVLVDKMETQPYCCTACGSNPTDVHGRPRQAIFAEGVDVDWGNSLYLCDVCSEIIADLKGRVSREEHEALQKDYRKLSKEYATLESRFRKVAKKAKDMRRGLKAAGVKS